MTVCDIAWTCCDVAWDSMCAELANAVCGQCSMDCNADGTPDACEPDSNGNHVPDPCEATADCNGNGISDDVDIASGRSVDCGGVAGEPDECEIAKDPRLDRDRNGVLDSCEQNPCDEAAGPSTAAWIGLAIPEQPWEGPYNWQPSDASTRNRPGWTTDITDALFAPRIMDTVLHCDQFAGTMTFNETLAYIALGGTTLEFRDRDLTPASFGTIALNRNAALILDPRWTERSERNGLLRAGAIESARPEPSSHETEDCDDCRTQLWSSPSTRIHAYEHISLRRCEISLSGSTSTPLFETVEKTVMDARGTLRPISVDATTPKLAVDLSGTLRAWRVPYDSEGSLVITRRTEEGPLGEVTRIEHTSRVDNPATLLVVWDWRSSQPSIPAVIDAFRANARVELRGALQVDTSLAAGTPSASTSPEIVLIRQSAIHALGRYSLIGGTPPRGTRFEQREIQTSEPGNVVSKSLMLQIVAERSVDPSTGDETQTDLGDQDVAKAAADLDGDGVDEVVVVLRRRSVPGEIRAYRRSGDTLESAPSWTVSLGKCTDQPIQKCPQPIQPWDGVIGDGQPLDVGDFNGDGRLDLAVACEGDAPFQLFENTTDPTDPARAITFRAAIRAEPLPTNERPTCVAIVPSPSTTDSTSQAPGFVGGVMESSPSLLPDVRGKLYRYSISGGASTRGSGVYVSGVPRSARGGGTVGNQGVGIATGGSTRNRTLSVTEDWSGFVQWVPVIADWHPQRDASTGLDTSAAAIRLEDELPCDLVVLPVPQDALRDDRICIATANAPGSANDVTVLRGSGVATPESTGFDSIVPLRTAMGDQGALSIGSARLFRKPSGSVPDLLVTRRDGVVAAARTDLDPVGGLAVGYVVRISEPSETRSAIACNAGSAGATAVVASVPTSMNLVPGNALTLKPLRGGEARSEDLDASGEVDFGDVNMILLEMGPCVNCPADLDGNGYVDLGDIALVMLVLGETS